MNLCICACTNLISDVSGDVAHRIAKSIDSASIPQARRVCKGHLDGDLVVRWSGHPNLSGHICRQPLASLARNATLARDRYSD